MHTEFIKGLNKTFDTHSGIFNNKFLLNVKKMLNV